MHLVVELHIVNYKIFEFVLIHETVLTEFVVDFVGLADRRILLCHQLQEYGKGLPGYGLAGLGQEVEQLGHGLANGIVAGSLHLFVGLGALDFFEVGGDEVAFGEHSFKLNLVGVEVGVLYNLDFVPLLAPEEGKDGVLDGLVLLLFPALLGLIFPKIKHFKDIKRVDRFSNNRQSLLLLTVLTVNNFIIMLILLLLPDSNSHMFLCSEITEQLLRFMIEQFIHIRYHQYFLHIFFHVYFFHLILHICRYKQLSL